jgi:hypothetical protein
MTVIKKTKHNAWLGLWDFKLYGADGKLKEAWISQNALADEGESSMLDTYFRATNTPSTFYIRLFNDTPTETDTLADLTGEPSTNGYAAIEITRDSTGFPTLALDSGDYQVVSKQVTFLATTGSFGPVIYAVLATTSNNTGKLIAYVALSMSRTLAAGESLKVTLTLKLQ